MEGLCITGTYQVEYGLDDGERYVYAVRHNNDEDTDIYFLKQEHTKFAHNCRDASVVIVKCNLHSPIYNQAFYNSQRVQK
jgi:hypothetical protein